jgi:hypothetical protein
MAKTVADQFAQILIAAGVKRIYGIVNGLTDSIRRQRKIEWVHVRHEEVAAFAAGAEAQLSGALAVPRRTARRSSTLWPTVCAAKCTAVSTWKSCSIPPSLADLAPSVARSRRRSAALPKDQRFVRPPFALEWDAVV